MNEDRSVVEINEHSLDKECLRLPRDYLAAAIESADAKRDVDRAKADLDLAEADFSIHFRSEAAKTGEKITESQLKTVVACQPKFLRAQQQVIKAKHRADLAQAVVWAIEAKKRSLTLLVDLHGMGYFSSPRITENGKKAVEEMTKRRVRRADNRRIEE